MAVIICVPPVLLNVVYWVVAVPLSSAPSTGVIRGKRDPKVGSLSAKVTIVPGGIPIV